MSRVDKLYINQIINGLIDFVYNQSTLSLILFRFQYIYYIKMKRILLALVLTVLAISALTENAPSIYNVQENITLVENILNLGYSLDQKHLVVLQNNVQGQFIIFQGIRGNLNRTIEIGDDLQESVTPISFKFSGDEDNTDMLLIGSTQGGVYGFTINNGRIQFPHKYQYNFADKTENFSVTTIGVTINKRIIVGIKDLLLVLEVPAEGRFFTLVKSFKVPNAKVQSVVCSPIDPNIALIGAVGADQGLFAFYDIDKNQTYEINKDQTLSVVFFPDGNKIAQGKLSKNVEIFTSNGTQTASLLIISEISTIGATQLFIDLNGTHISTQIKSTNLVQAWSIIQTTLPSNLHTLNNLQAFQVKNSLNTGGTNLATTYNGNQILIIVPGETPNLIQRYNLCDDGKFLQNNECTVCTNGCQTCFNADTCLSCPKTKETFITVQNTCKSCAQVTSGCKTCQDQKQCATCDTEKGYRQSISPAGKCLCQENTYEQIDKCVTCFPLDHCQICDGKDHCLKCFDIDNFNPQPNVQGVCVCNDGYYLDSQGACQSCSIIPGCLKCTNADTCTACNNDEAAHFDPNIDEGKCKCLRGFGLNKTQCQPCSSFIQYCFLCSKDGQQCTDCGAEQRVLVDNTCQCRGHTYEAQDMSCKLCDQPYQKCMRCQWQQPHTCKECDTEKHYTKQPENGVCKCQSGYIQENNKCVICAEPGCDQCQIIEICTQCSEYRHFIPQPLNNICICQQGRYKTDDGRDCLTCGQGIDGCSDCDNLKECKVCNGQGHFNLNNITKLCECDNTYFKNNKQCKLCSQKISQCSQCNQDGSVCKSCRDSFYLAVNKCQLCSNEFQYCQNCNNKECLSCQEHFSLNQEKDKCTCPDDRTIDDGKCVQKGGLGALAIVGIVVGILALAGGVVAIIKCYKKKQSPLQNDEYEPLDSRK